ncbi:hypothetical protein GCM10028857_22420 [Salinarchaeum chitinilyticum]
MTGEAGRPDDSPSRTDRSAGERPPDDTSSPRSTDRLDRRDLLRLGAVGLATAVAGCSGGDSGRDEPTNETDSPPPTDADEIPYADEYGTVVDVVAQGGADPTASESIVPVLDEHARDDTLLYFPPGRYLLNDLWELPSFEHLAVVGEDATIVPQDGDFGYLFVFGLPDHSAADLRFEGMQFDFSAEDTAPRPIQAQIEDGLVVQDVTVEGIGGTARFDVTDPDGEGVIRNLQMPDGGREPNPVGVLVGPANQGSLRFEDCRVSGFPGNGLYASPSNGPIEVVGGTYENNGIASVRVSSPATVRDVTVRCDQSPQGFRNMRGIRLRHGESILVENCTIEMHDLTYTDGGLVIEPMMESATVRNVDIECSVDGYPAVHVKTAQHDATDTEIDFQGVTVTGSSGDGSAVQISDRNNCLLDDLDIQQTGTSRDGVHLVRTTNSTLRDSEIDVTGDPLVLDHSQLQRTNNRL